MAGDREILKSFLVSLGWDVDEKGMAAANAAVAGFTTKIMTMGAVVVAAAAAVVGGMMKVAGTEAELLHLSERTDISVLKLKELSYAAELLGSDAATAKSSIEGFAMMAGRVASGIGGRAKKAFEFLGMNVTKEDLKDVVGLMFRVGEKIKDLPKAQQIGLLSRMGIDRTMLQLVTEGVGELGDEMKAVFGSNAEEVQAAAEASHQFENEWKRIKMVVGAIITKAYRGMIVATAETFSRIRKMLVENIAKIKPVLEKIMDVISATAGLIAGVLVTALKILAPVIEYIVSGLATFLSFTAQVISQLSGPFLGALAGIGLAFGVAFAPITTALILIGLLLSAIEDFTGYLEGKQSAFPEFWKTYGDSILSAWETTKEVAGRIKNVLSIIFQTIFYSVDALIKLLDGDFRGAWDTVKSFGEEALKANPFGMMTPLGKPAAAAPGSGSNVVNMQSTFNTSGVSDPNAASNMIRNDQERLAQDLLRNLKSPIR